MVVKYGGKQPSVSHKPKKMVTQRGCLNNLGDILL